MMERRILLKLAYDGSSFSGWQIQDHAKSVQATIERALFRMSKDRIKLVCSGRTDTGVHAIAQYAHFDYHGKMEANTMVKALNRLLDHDIRILAAQDVSSDFHARYKAFERSYLYKLAKEISPFQRLYMGYMVNQMPDLNIMKKLSEVYIGKHDYSSFAVDNPEIPNRMCEIKLFSINEYPDRYEFMIVADRFLHNMVRRMVGTLVNLCTKELEPEVLHKVLLQAHPKQTLVLPAPAAGLYLAKVSYPEQYNIII